MADITKKVNRGVPPTERTQNFTQADAVESDVLLVEDSLGRPARKILIETTATLAVRLNVYHMVFPNREFNDFMETKQLPNLTGGTQIKDDTGALITLEADETFEYDGAVSDIELVAVSGQWDILTI